MYHFISGHFPTGPGCYLMKNSLGQVIYVGKAKNLRRRLGQYFQTTRQVGKTRWLVSEIDQVEVILVHTEVESLILENNLIKRYHPRYNIMMMADDSGYGYIVQTGEEYPRLLPYRKHRINPRLDHPVKPVAVEKRYGPYLSSSVRDTLIKCIGESCGIRDCSPMGKKVCFQYHLKRCSGPCEGLVSLEEYTERVERAAGFLAAPHLRLIDYLTSEMNSAADALEFERARHLRDQINALKTVFENQVVELDVRYDQDVMYLRGKHAVVLHLKRGALVGLDWLPQAPASHSPEAFALAYYRGYPVQIPREIIINALPDPTLTEAVLMERSGHEVQVILPERGPQRDLLDIARINLEYREKLHETLAAEAARQAAEQQPAG